MEYVKQNVKLDMQMMIQVYAILHAHLICILIQGHMTVLQHVMIIKQMTVKTILETHKMVHALLIVQFWLLINLKILLLVIVFKNVHQDTGEIQVIILAYLSVFQDSTVTKALHKELVILQEVLKFRLIYLAIHNLDNLSLFARLLQNYILGIEIGINANNNAPNIQEPNTMETHLPVNVNLYVKMHLSIVLIL